MVKLPFLQLKFQSEHWMKERKSCVFPIAMVKRLTTAFAIEILDTAQDEKEKGVVRFPSPLCVCVLCRGGWP